MKNFLLFPGRLLLIVSLLILYSCDSEPEIEPPIPIPVGEVGVKLNDENLTFSELEREIEVTVYIENFPNLGRLSIVKKATEVDTLMTLLPAEIDSVYHFRYEVKEEEKQQFELEFIAFKKDDKIGSRKTVVVTEVADPTYEVTMELEKDTVIYNEENKKIAVQITFENPDYLKELQIKWKDGGKELITIFGEEIISPYTFEYEIKSSDPDRFTLTFDAIDQEEALASTADLFVSLEGIVIKNLVRLSRVTGKTLAGETFMNPNRTDERYNLGGTDLGIMWEMDPGKVGIFFGDSYGGDWVTTDGGGPGIASAWRSNVLAFAEETQLDRGLKLSGMAVDQNGEAKEIIYSAKQGTDFTSIPTAAIRANGVDYVHYFNLRAWDPWTINYSSLYSSSDNGQTWRSQREVTFGTKSRFAMVGYAKKDGYVYMIGTPSGRLGKAHLARFSEKDILNKGEYEYWNGDEQQWIKGDEEKATPLWDKNVGELSFMYHEKYQRWIITYSAGEGDIHAMLYRDAKEITGPWTKAKILVDGINYPGLYGPYVHPVKNKEDQLYFNMSQWWPYNVFFMRVDMEVYQ